MEQNKGIEYKGWTITISVLSDGFSIEATSKEGISVPGVGANFGKLGYGVDGMKKIIDTYEKGRAVGLKELEEFGKPKKKDSEKESEEG